MTQKFKDLVEEIDPGVHQFVPISLFQRKTGEQYTHTQFYTFFCGRLLEIEPHEEPISNKKTDIFSTCGMPGNHPYHFKEVSPGNKANFILARVLNTIATRPDLIKLIEDFPLWRLYPSKTYGVGVASRLEIFITREVAQGLKKKKLKGLLETTNKQERDISHVYFDV